jgi:hypothetical protein
MTETREGKPERCWYYADWTDYRCTRKVGHDGAHCNKDAARCGESQTWTCHCPDCVKEREVSR